MNLQGHEVGEVNTDKQHELKSGRRNEGGGASRVAYQLTTEGDTNSSSGPQREGSRGWGQVQD